MLHGFAVSPGCVTAAASVVRSPADFAAMQPGSILVCPTTTPAWTPLFGQARGLVTDVGGILAHGSIVAREYGIPAVMGIGNATQRITHGRVIAVDGDAGTVTLSGVADELLTNSDSSRPGHLFGRRGFRRLRTTAKLVAIAGGALSVAAWLARRNRGAS
jgi:phosphoenolpyruvate synthase/pyruvate phosphate dikinase